MCLGEERLKELKISQLEAAVYCSYVLVAIIDCS